RGFPAARLVFEVTESMLDLTADVRRRLGALCDLGVALAIDDFGTGYSSLARVGGLPVRELKIDRSLLTGDGRLLGAVREFGKSLGVRVVIEGVETQAELAMVGPLRFDGVQGFALA